MRSMLGETRRKIRWRASSRARTLTRRIVEHEPEYGPNCGSRSRANPRAARACRCGEGRRSNGRGRPGPLRGQMPERELRRMVYGIGATLGIETLVWLTDMGGLSREEATEVMRSNARTLLRSALERLG